MEINIKLLSPTAIAPTYETAGAAGADLYADLASEARLKFSDSEDPHVLILPGYTEMINCGFSIAIPMGFAGSIRSRSGLARNGIIVANSPGTIDSDYRGAVCVLLHNLGRYPYKLFHGSRIAQMLIVPIEIARFLPVESLPETKRGAKGFGSTGV